MKKIYLAKRNGNGLPCVPKKFILNVFLTILLSVNLSYAQFFNYGGGDISGNVTGFNAAGTFTGYTITGNDFTTTASFTWAMPANAGPNPLVLNFHDFTVAAGHILTITGINSGPVIIRCTGICKIDGTINCAASPGGNGNSSNGGSSVVGGGGGGRTGGFGGYGQNAGGANGSSYGTSTGRGVGGTGGSGGSGTSAGAGGGGSYGTAGIAGTNGSVSGGGIGSVYGDAGLTTIMTHGAFTTNILGGSGGGGGGGCAGAAGGNAAGAGAGGGGGGAIQITANTITMGASGLITVKGGQGGNGSATTGRTAASGGGGSGGTILLQTLTTPPSPAVNTTATTTATSGLDISGGRGGTSSPVGGNGGTGRYLIQQDVVGCSPPASEPTAFSSSNVFANTATVSWTRPSLNGGDKVIVIMKMGSAVDGVPTNEITYNAGADFNYSNPNPGTVSQLGTGNYVVYIGTGSSVNLTNLVPNKTYHFAVYEFLNSGPCYAVGGTTPLMGNITTGNGNMVYVSSTVTQASIATATQGQTNQAIVAVQVVTGGSLSPLTLSSLRFTTSGSTSVSDISNAKVYYTGTSSTFATGTQFGTTLSNPNGTFSITPASATALSEGTNYFWLAYDVASGATPGNVLDAQSDLVTMSDGTHIPSTISPIGSRTVASLTYCTTGATSSACQSGNDFWITAVSIDNGSTFNFTGGTCVGSPNYLNTGYTGNVTQGLTYNLSVSKAGTSWQTGFTVWIDWSSNGTLNDASPNQELIMQTSNVASPATRSVSFSVPSNVAPGIHRMRVRIQYNTSPSDPCASNGQGEVKDFNLNVLAGCTVPSNNAGALTYSNPNSNLTNSSVDISFTRPNPAGSGGLLIVGKATSAPTGPISGTGYNSPSLIFSSPGSTTASGSVVVYNSNAVAAGGNGTITVTGLNAGTTYFFNAYEWNSASTCYQLTGTGSSTFIPVCNPPSVQVNNFSLGTSGVSTQVLNWGNNGNPDGAIVVIKSGSAPTDPTYSTAYSADGTNTFGNNTAGFSTAAGSYVVYKSSGTSVNVNGLQPSTTYFYKIYTYTASTNCYNLTSPVSGSFTTQNCNPSANASAFTPSDILNTTATVSWTRGNGNRVLVVARAGSAVTTTGPSIYNQNFSAVANAAYGTGTAQIASTGNYVVYDGTGTSVDLTGLSNATTYHFAIFEYVTSPNNCYSTSPLTANLTTLDATTSGGCNSSATYQIFNYSSIIGTSGVSLVASGAAIDDDNYANKTFAGFTNGSGFVFNYKGVDYSSFGINANGFIWFGPGTPGSTYASYGGGPLNGTSANLGSSTGNINGVIAALGADLTSHQHLFTSPNLAQINVVISGASPNRVCTIEWNGFVEKGCAYDVYNLAGQCKVLGFLYCDEERLDFQIKLYENAGTNANRIEMSYFNQEAAYTWFRSGYSAQVGLRGTSNANVQCWSGTAGAWSTATVVTTNSTVGVIRYTSGSNYGGIGKGLTPPASDGFRYIQTIPTSSVTPSDEATNNCPDLTATLTSSSGTTYQWFKDGELVPGPGSSSQNYVATQSGFYSVVTKTGSCYAPSSSTQVNISSCGPNAYNVTGGTENCGFAFIGTDNSQDGVEYELYRDDVPLGITAPGLEGLGFSFDPQVDAGVYTIVGRDISGNTTLMTGNAIIYDPPIVSADNGGPYCSYETISLTSLPAGMDFYQWSNGAETRNTTLAALSNGGDYEVTVTDSHGCTGSALTTVVVNDAPVISIDHSTSNVCSGELTTLEASGANTYSWLPLTRLDVTGINGETADANPTANITYTVTGTDGNGCSGSATAAFTIKPAPAITAVPTSVVCTGGISASLSVSGDPLTTYAWLPNSFLNTYTGTNVSAQISQLTIYTVTGTGSNGCTASVVIPVATVPVGGIITPVNTVICDGGAKTLTASGMAGNSYQWQISPDNVVWDDIIGATGTSYATIAANGHSKKYYRIKARSNACWDVASTTAIVDISVTPVVTVTGTGSDNVQVSWTPFGSQQYSISWSGLAGSGTIAANLVTSNNITVPGLLANKTVTVTVTPVTPVCGSNAGSVVTHTVCDRPTITNLTATASHGFQLNWSAVSGVTDYRIYYRNIGNSNAWSFTDVSGVTARTFTNMGGGTYVVYVAAKGCPLSTDIGTGSEQLYVTMNPQSSCTTPTVSAISNCPNQISVGLSGGSGSYVLSMRRISPTISSGASYTINGSGVNITVGTQYSGSTWEIFAKNICAGSTLSEISNIVIVTVKPGCSVINNVVLSNPNCHGFVASWNTDDCQGLGISGYQVLIKTSTATGYSGYPVGAVDHVNVSWLTQGKTYNVVVMSLACNGASSAYSVVQTVPVPFCNGREDEEPQALIENNEESVTVYPNPGNGTFMLNIGTMTMEEQDVKTELVNQLGQVLMTDISAMSGGSLNRQLTAPQQTATGVYYLRTTIGDNVYINRLMINKE